MRSSEMLRRSRLFVSACVAALCAFGAFAESVKVSACVRDPNLDYWAADDARFCGAVMDEVFRSAGLEAEFLPFREDGFIDGTEAEVICSAFITPELAKDYAFASQPLGKMHYALYASPARAVEMASTKITDWPRMRVGYSPAAQGQSGDREDYFDHANLSPKYVEFPTSAGAVDALYKGEIDALFLYTAFGRRPDGVVEIVPIGDRDVVFAVRKDRPDLFKRLTAAYRDFYIDHIDKIDEWRERMLGVKPPDNRVRVAAYQRGGMFSVSDQGEITGTLHNWFKAICTHTHWVVDYVYGSYDDSLEDVKNGRLDLVGGIGFSAARRKNYLFPHTPIGMLRAYLWTHPDGRYQPGDPETWRGMKVGLLTNAISSEKARRQFDKKSFGISYVEYSSSSALLAAYLNGDVDAIVDVEQPQLSDELALHVYAAHPMYICVSRKRQDLFFELETAFESICEDFPKYQRMIAEHHYGRHSDMAALSMSEIEWLVRRKRDPKPIVIDFSPWPFPVFDDSGKPTGFIAKFLGELSRKTGLLFLPAVQTGIQTAEAKFLRGDTDLWIPYPMNNDASLYGSVPVFSIPVPQMVARHFGDDDMQQQDFELFARRSVPAELVSIIRKVVTDMDSSQFQEMFMSAIVEGTATHRVFGLTAEELKAMLYRVSYAVIAFIALMGVVMGLLLKRQADMANEAARLAEDHAQAKTRFLAMMSHELRTPLNAVIGFAEFLVREDTTEQMRKEYVDSILVSSHALLELINDILDLSKLEAGAMKMRAGCCDVSQLLRELPAIFGYRVRKHGVNLNIDAPADGEIPALELSQQGVRQILINLVGNAAKFTTDGEIKVVARWLDDTRTLHFEVSDTGCGMSDDKLARLFDPFVQDIASRLKVNADQEKGTGLGLPIVKRMVDAAGGTITVDSALGRGTKFVIDIPGLSVVERVRPAVKAAETALRMAAIPDRVLVVDDMTMNRKILGIHLGNLKVKDIRYAENGVKAIEVMDEWLPDVVLTDMWMPEMDGTQLAEAMRKDRRLAEIPIVAVTADVDVGSTYDMALFAKVISKPVTGAKLKELFGVS